MIGAAYIAGTDTGIGKTWVTAALVRGLRGSGVDAVGMKPVASGCVETASGWRNDDAQELLAANGMDDADYDAINPFALPLPASPHLAAASAGRALAIAPIGEAVERLRQQHTAVLVEGVGGWAVPFGTSPWWFQADLVKALDLPVLLVVGLRLGCINHALLTARAMADDGCRVLGWVGNVVDPEWSDCGTVAADLAELLPVPLLGRIGYGQPADPVLVSRVTSVLHPDGR